jgi:hypothetical protein
VYTAEVAGYLGGLTTAVGSLMTLPMLSMALGLFGIFLFSNLAGRYITSYLGKLLGESTAYKVVSNAIRAFGAVFFWMELADVLWNLYEHAVKPLYEAGMVSPMAAAKIVFNGICTAQKSLAQVFRGGINLLVGMVVGMVNYLCIALFKLVTFDKYAGERAVVKDICGAISGATQNMLSTVGTMVGNILTVAAMLNVSGIFEGGIWQPDKGSGGSVLGSG